MKQKRLLAAFLVILVIGTFLAVWSFPFFLRHLAANFLGKATGLDVSLSKLSYRSPSTLVLSECRFFGKGRERFHAEEIALTLRLKTLFSKTLVLEDLVVENPSIWLHRAQDGTLDLFHLFRKGSSKDAPVQRRKFFVRSLSVTGGTLALLDEAVQGEPYTTRLGSLTGNVQGLSFPPHNRESPITLHAFVEPGRFPPSGSLRLKGWINMGKRDAKFIVELQDIDLVPWDPYTAHSIPMGLARGRMDFDGQVKIQQQQLQGYGLIRIQDLAFRRTPTTGLLETVFGVSQEELIVFLEDSHGELSFPLKVSGQLNDPTFELGELFTRSIRQSLARTLQRGVGGMMQAGSQTLGIADLERRTKRVVKELKKTLRLDWLISGTLPLPEDSQ